MEEVLMKLKQIQSELREVKELIRLGSTDNSNNFNILEKRLGDLVRKAKDEILDEIKLSK